MQEASVTKDKLRRQQLLRKAKAMLMEALQRQRQGNVIRDVYGHLCRGSNLLIIGVHSRQASGDRQNRTALLEVDILLVVLVKYLERYTRAV